MEKYIKPIIKVKRIDVESLLAADSPSVNFSGNPDDVPEASDDDYNNANESKKTLSWSDE